MTQQSAAFRSLDEKVKQDIAMIYAMESHGGIEENAERQSTLTQPYIHPGHPLADQIERMGWSTIYRTYSIGHLLRTTEEWSRDQHAYIPMSNIPASWLWMIDGHTQLSHKRSAAFFEIADRLTTAAGMMCC